MKGSLDDIFGGKVSRDIPDQGTKEDEDIGACASLGRRGVAHFGIGIKKPGRKDKIVEYFDLEGEGDNASIKIILGARKVWELDIEGRNLLRLLYLLKERRIEWLRQADRDFSADDGKPFISRLEIHDVTERERPEPR